MRNKRRERERQRERERKKRKKERRSLSQSVPFLLDANGASKTERGEKQRFFTRYEKEGDGGRTTTTAPKQMPEKKLL